MVSSGFEEKYDRFKNRFLVLFKNMDPKVSSPEDSSRVVAHENIYFSNGKYETRSFKLADENAKH